MMREKNELHLSDFIPGCFPRCFLLLQGILAAVVYWPSLKHTEGSHSQVFVQIVILWSVLLPDAPMPTLHLLQEYAHRCLSP